MKISLCIKSVLGACLLTMGMTSANAAVNYLVVKGTAGWTANAGSNSAVMTATIAASCSVNDVGYYGFGTILLQTSTGFVSGGVYTGFPYTRNTQLCVAGVPDTITLTPAGNSAPSPIVLTLGGAYQTLTTINTNPKSVGIVLPDQSMIVLYAFSYYYNPSATSYYGDGLNRIFSQLSPIVVSNQIPAGSPFTISGGNGSICYAPSQMQFGPLNGVSANICANYLVGF